MDAETGPWIEINSPPLDGLQSAELNYHALFACVISVRTAEERQGFLWGFNWGSLLQDAIERQRLFILSQHLPGEPRPEDFKDCRTLSLRCIRRPSTPGLQIGLIGKICAPTAQEARISALDFWRAIQSAFPYDYQIIPADRETFQRLSGQEILKEANDASMFAEVQRYQTKISTGKEWFYYLGRWKHSDFATEQIWRTLAGSNRRMIYDVMLRPTVIDETELASLEFIADHVQKIADEVKDFRVQPYAEYAAGHYRDLFQRLRRPYIVQTRLVAPDGLPAYIPRMIGFAYTYDPERESILPNFQVIQPENTIDEIALWQKQLRWLEPDLRVENSVDRRFARINKMCDFHEAQTLFRYPYPPRGGFPDLTLSGSPEN